MTTGRARVRYDDHGPIQGKDALRAFMQDWLDMFNDCRAGARRVDRGGGRQGHRDREDQRTGQAERRRDGFDLRGALDAPRREGRVGPPILDTRRRLSKPLGCRSSRFGREADSSHGSGGPRRDDPSAMSRVRTKSGGLSSLRRHGNGGSSASRRFSICGPSSSVAAKRGPTWGKTGLARQAHRESGGTGLPSTSANTRSGRRRPCAAGRRRSRGASPPGGRLTFQSRRSPSPELSRQRCRREAPLLCMEGSTPSRDTGWAMSQENVELVRGAFALMSIPGDSETMIAASDPSFEMHLVQVGGGAAYYAGASGIREFSATWPRVGNRSGLRPQTSATWATAFWSSVMCEVAGG